MKRLALLAVLVAAGCGGSDPPSQRAGTPASRPVACQHPRVNHTPYPGGAESLAGIPWIRGDSGGLVGLLWYWPSRWGDSRTARVFTGGVGPDGQNAKIMWVFLDPSARDRADGELRIEGRNLDGDGTFSESFSAIGYEGQQGAPSYASIIDLPEPGCWRLTLTTGDLRATVDLPAVAQRCAPARVNHTSYPGLGDGAWVRGTPRSSGLAVVLGYWPPSWRRYTRARVYTDGRAPGGVSAKAMWAFFGPASRGRGGSHLVLTGRNLEGSATIRDTFAAISYEGQNGAPSYASTINLPEPGCWRLTATTGDLQGTVDIEAVAP